jgi:hypothetical protein
MSPGLKPGPIPKARTPTVLRREKQIPFGNDKKAWVGKQHKKAWLRYGCFNQSERVSV